MIDDEEADDHTIIQSVQVYNDEFIVDKIGEPIGAKDPRGACWDVPDYSWDKQTDFYQCLQFTRVKIPLKFSLNFKLSFLSYW